MKFSQTKCQEQTCEDTQHTLFKLHKPISIKNECDKEKRRA